MRWPGHAGALAVGSAGQPVPCQCHARHEQKQLPRAEPHVASPCPPCSAPRGPVVEVLVPRPPVAPPVGASHQPQLPPSAEVNALVELYQSTQGESWLNSSGWLAGSPCADEWHGLVCCPETHPTLRSLERLFGLLDENFGGA